MHADHISLTRLPSGAGPAEASAQPPITRSSSPSPAPDGPGGEALVDPPARAGHDGILPLTRIRLAHPDAAHGVPDFSSLNADIGTVQFYLTMLVVVAVGMLHAVSRSLPSGRDMADLRSVLLRAAGQVQSWMGAPGASRGDEASETHETAMAPASLPGELAEHILDYLEPEHAFALAQVDREHCQLAAYPAAAFLLQRRAQSLLDALPSMVRGFRFDVPSWRIVRQANYLREIVLLVGSPRDAAGQGGSGILGLPHRHRDQPLAVLSALADAVIGARRHAVVQAIQALRSAPQPSLADFLAVLIEEIKTSADVKLLLGRPHDEDGTGGHGILTLPMKEQAGLLRRLNERVSVQLPYEDGDKQRACALLALPTVRTGDPEALAHLTSPWMFDNPMSDDAGFDARGLDTLDTLRTLWAAAMAPPLEDKVPALHRLLHQFGKFPTDERVQRFVEQLSAWEQLVQRDPLRFRQPVGTRSRWSGKFDEGLLSSIHVELRKVLPSVPVAFHPEGKRRIEALRRAIDAGPVGQPR